MHFAELLWSDLGNDHSLEACASIAELACRQCRELPWWLRSQLRASPASLRLFTAEMDRRGWKRHEINLEFVAEVALGGVPLGRASILSEASAHCPRCGWEAFPHEAPNGRCPDCGALVNPPAFEIPRRVSLGELVMAS